MKLELGKIYNFIGYKWIPFENYGEEVCIQSLGITIGPWPGYTLKDCGNGNFCRANLPESVDFYDDKTLMVAKALASINGRPEGFSLWLPFTGCERNHQWMEALQRACSYSHRKVWTGSYGNVYKTFCGKQKYTAWCVDKNGNFSKCSQDKKLTIAPCARLKLSKIIVQDNKIVIAEK